MIATQTVPDLTEEEVGKLAEAVLAEVIAVKEAKIATDRREQRNISASIADDPCNRWIWYSVVQGEEKAQIDWRKQALFDQGHYEADATATDLTLRTGMRLEGQETSFSCTTKRGRTVTGSMDWFLTGGVLGQMKVPCEHKGLSYGAGDKWETWRDMMQAKSRWTRRYAGQMQLYLWQSTNPWGFFIPRNKEAGTFRIMPVSLDVEFVDRVLAKADDVYDYIELGEPPDRIAYDPSLCPETKCDFHHLCQPEQAIQVDELGVVFDEVLEQQVARYLELAPLATEHDLLDKAIKVWAKATGRQALIVGEGLIEVKQVVKQFKAVPAKEAFSRTDTQVKILPRKSGEEVEE